MGNSGKILKVVFVILLLVTIGELGYYVYVLKGNPSKSMNTPSQNTSGSVPTQVENLEAIPTSYLSTKLNGNTVVERVINYDSTEYLKTVLIPTIEASKAKSNQQFYILKVDKGIVGTIEFNPSTNLLMIQLVDEEGKEIETYHTPQRKIDKQKFLKKTNNDYLPITYEVIKKNDKITISSYFDLLDLNNSFQEYKVE